MLERRILGSSVVTRNFQITIPSRVREKFPISEGDLILFIFTQDGKSQGWKLEIEKG